MEFSEVPDGTFRLCLLEIRSPALRFSSVGVGSRVSASRRRCESRRCLLQTADRTSPWALERFSSSAYLQAVLTVVQVADVLQDKVEGSLTLCNYDLDNFVTMEWSEVGARGWHCRLWHHPRLLSPPCIAHRGGPRAESSSGLRRRPSTAPGHGAWAYLPCPKPLPIVTGRLGLQSSSLRVLS